MPPCQDRGPLSIPSLTISCKRHFAAICPARLFQFSPSDLANVISLNVSFLLGKRLIGVAHRDESARIHAVGRLVLHNRHDRTSESAQLDWRFDHVGHHSSDNNFVRPRKFGIVTGGDARKDTHSILAVVEEPRHANDGSIWP